MSAHDERDDAGPPDASAGHETRDISVRGVVLFGASLAMAAVLIHVAIWGLYRYMTAEADAGETVEYPLAVGAGRQLPPAPRLQVQPREELKALRREEEAVLNRYAWVDAGTGIVRIPIERAMALVLERGLPTRESLASSPAPGPGEGPRR